MTTKPRYLSLVCSIVVFVIAPFAVAQYPPETSLQVPNQQAQENAEQVAKILGISQLLSNARALHTNTACGTPVTVEELSMRQDLLESIVIASLDVDGVLAELDNERARLYELSAALQSRRDHTVNLLNVANLITGTGVGIGVNALQFSSSTANFGNGLGVSSGIGSTVLSIIGIRRQRGPLAGIGRVPNMLAPLFGREAKLNSYYPPTVLDYLHTAPAGTGTERQSRLDRLIAEWRQAGRVGPDGAASTEKQITLLTASSDEKAKLSIDALSDRVAMLSDVAGTVALMKRDIAQLMRSIRGGRDCPSK